MYIVVKLPSWNEKYLFYQVTILRHQNIKVCATELFNGLLIHICISNPISIHSLHYWYWQLYGCYLWHTNEIIFAAT